LVGHLRHLKQKTKVNRGKEDSKRLQYYSIDCSTNADIRIALADLLHQPIKNIFHILLKNMLYQIMNNKYKLPFLLIINEVLY